MKAELRDVVFDRREIGFDFVVQVSVACRGALRFGRAGALGSVRHAMTTIALARAAAIASRAAVASSWA